MVNGQKQMRKLQKKDVYLKKNNLKLVSVYLNFLNLYLQTNFLKKNLLYFNCININFFFNLMLILLVRVFKYKVLLNNYLFSKSTLCNKNNLSMLSFNFASNLFNLYKKKINLIYIKKKLICLKVIKKNIFVTIINEYKNVIFKFSKGSIGFKGKKKKSYPIAIKQIIKILCLFLSVYKKKVNFFFVNKLSVYSVYFNYFFQSFNVHSCIDRPILYKLYLSSSYKNIQIRRVFRFLLKISKFKKKILKLIKNYVEVKRIRRLIKLQMFKIKRTKQYYKNKYFRAKFNFKFYKKFLRLGCRIKKVLSLNKNKIINVQMLKINNIKYKVFVLFSLLLNRSKHLKFLNYQTNKLTKLFFFLRKLVRIRLLSKVNLISKKFVLVKKLSKFFNTFVQIKLFSRNKKKKKFFFLKKVNKLKEIVLLQNRIKNEIFVYLNYLINLVNTTSNKQIYLFRFNQLDNKNNKVLLFKNQFFFFSFKFFFFSVKLLLFCLSSKRVLNFLGLFFKFKLIKNNNFFNVCVKSVKIKKLFLIKKYVFKFLYFFLFLIFWFYKI